VFFINTDNSSKVVEAARFFDDSRFGVEEMLMKFSRLKGMEKAALDQERQLEILKKKSRRLEEMIQHQDGQLAERKLKNRELDELKEMGFGLWDLKVLRNLVTELAIENGQPTQNGVAVKKFVSDIEIRYPDYLRLREWVSQLEAAEIHFRTMMGAIEPLGSAVSSFLQRKPSKGNIKEIIKLIETHPKAPSVDSSSYNAQDHSQNGLKNSGSAAAASNEMEWKTVSDAPTGGERGRIS